LDKSKDGYICVHEIEGLMNELKGEFTSIIGHDPNWKTIIDSLDTNNDGKLDFNEFISAATNRVILLNEENLIKAFSILDTNDDGRVSAKELQERFAQGVYAAGSNLKLDDAFFDRLLSECDSN
jgi:Ca2+-binding EF-hand superfamily protein